MKNCAKRKRRKLLISIDISQHNPISLPPIMKIQVKLIDSTVIIKKKKKNSLTGEDLENMCLPCHCRKQ